MRAVGRLLVVLLLTGASFEAQKQDAISWNGHRSRAGS